MRKVKIEIDKKWPIFVAYETDKEDPCIVEVEDDFFREYCWFCFKYHDFQLKLQFMYESKQGNLNE